MVVVSNAQEVGDRDARGQSTDRDRSRKVLDVVDRRRERQRDGRPCVAADRR